MSRYSISSRHSQHGLSLIELMIAIVLGLLISAGIVSMFIQSKRNYTQDELVAGMQETGRIAMYLLSRDLTTTNFWGQMSDTSSIVNDASLDIGTDCGTGSNTAYNIGVPLRYLSSDTPTNINTAFPCVAATEVDTGTGVLYVKRVEGAPTRAAGAAVSLLTTNAVYLRTTGTTGTLFKQTAGTTAPTADEADWEYLVHTYYIDNDTLKRKRLSPGTPATMQSQTLLEGVEQFQLQFGVDSDGDGTADFYTDSPTAANLTNAVAARIYVLVRSLNTAPNYTNTKSYQLGTFNVAAANDAFYRRVYTTTVLLRNMRAL